MTKKYLVYPLVLFLVVLLPFVSATNTTGLVAYYNFEQSNTTGAYDMWDGDSNQSALVGLVASGQTGVIGNGWTITAGTSNVSFPVSDFATGNGDRTIQAWVKTTSTANNQRYWGQNHATNGDGLYVTGPPYEYYSLIGNQDTNPAGYDCPPSTTNYELVTWMWNGATKTVSVWINGTMCSSVVQASTTNTIATAGLTLGHRQGTGSVGYSIDELKYWNRTLTSTEILNIYNNETAGCGAGNGTGWDCGSAPPPPSANVFTMLLPVNGQVQYYTNNSINITTNGSSFWNDTLVTLTHFLYNSTGSLLFQGNYSGTPNASSLITGLPVGQYRVNTSIVKDLVVNRTGALVYIYNITPGTVGNPLNNTNITSRYLNINWTNMTFNPSGSGVSQATVNVSLRNLDRSLNRTIVGSVNNNHTWDLYAENLTIGQYYLRFNYTDSLGQSALVDHLVNISRNTLVNITARKAIGNDVINNFSGWIYNTNGLNVTFNTTSGSVAVDQIRGNTTVFIDAPDYALISNITLISFSNTNVTYHYQFLLYETNTLNISFFDENTGLIINTTTVSMDLISDLYSNNYSTTNGTLYIVTLTPEEYTIRYSAPGYTTRFYTFTLDNRSFTNLQLYLINQTLSTNISIFVVDEVTNAVEGAIVKALKYDLATNTYILQEIGITDVTGKTIMSLTKNDEYYKFVVEYAGETMKTTNPAYITTDSITIQINFDRDIGQDYFDYESIDYTLAFNTASNNFRFDFNDVSSIASQFCLEVFRGVNFSRVLQNSSCLTTSSGTILLPVTAVNGTTYLARAYYFQDGDEETLATLTYEFPGSDALGTYGLFLQMLITLTAAALALASSALAMIVVPLSLIMGKIVGLNVLSWTALIPMQVIGFILAIVISIKK